MKTKTTKRALLLSSLALVLCISMLIGSTFAWFTDSITSKNNIIKSGNLDIELQYSTDASTWATVEETTKLFSEETLWEPGYTEVVYLKLVNKGSLALNYQVGINIDEETAGVNVAGESFNLSDYIEFDVIEDQNTAFADRAEAVAAAEAESRKLNEGYVKGNALLATGDEAFMAMVVYMPETVGNEANHNGVDVPQITFGVNVIATQKTYEEDSFGNDYDALAQGGIATVGIDYLRTGEWIDVRANGISNEAKVGSMVIDPASVEDESKPINISIVPTDLDNTVAVAADQDASTYEITVSNLKAGNTTPIKVELKVGKGLTGVKVYHKNVEIENASYDATTGYVKFETLSFSPYTVVFDAVDQEPTNSDLPVANVVNSTEYENVDLPWENYGSWSPTEGLDSQLEAAYTFSCVDTLEEAQASKYANWYCDFYVKLDQDLGENEIFLGGNYGDFGWIGFHNGDLTLEANTEIGLLTSVTTNPWTYADIVNFVGEFVCGVGDVDDALTGATFTVMLRLTNPENEAEFYNVSTINYTFN